MVFGLHRSPNNLQWAKLAARAEELKAKYDLEFDEFVSDLARMNPHNDRRLFL